jgi:hypothetical protein
VGMISTRIHGRSSAILTTVILAFLIYYVQTSSAFAQTTSQQTKPKETPVPQATPLKEVPVPAQAEPTKIKSVPAPTPLRDSFHLGQTIANDYGRPYEPGFNYIIGFSTISESGPFSLYVRGEYQHSPSAPGYSQALTNQLSVIDMIDNSTTNLNQATIPQGPIAAQNPFRLQEAVLSAHLFGHEISGGKSDAWLGPAAGGAMAWSNNAEDIYSFRINRVEPLHIPYVSRLIGPLRYDFFVGSLKGHTDPNDSGFTRKSSASLLPPTSVSPSSALYLGRPRTRARHPPHLSAQLLLTQRHHRS